MGGSVGISSTFLVSARISFVVYIPRRGFARKAEKNQTCFIFVCGCICSQSHISNHIEKGKRKMTQERVDMYLMTNQKYLPAEKIVFVKEKLLAADESKFNLVSAVE